MRIFVFVLLFASSLAAQHLGFSIDATGLNTTSDSRTMWPFPTGFSLLAGYTIIKDFQIEARVGYQVAMLEYSGVDAAILLNYYFKEPFYITGGFMHHSNSGVWEEGIKLTEAELLGIGAGVQITNALSFEVLYFQSLKKEPWIVHGSKFGTLQDPGAYWTENLTSVIRADIKFHWDLW